MRYALLALIFASATAYAAQAFFTGQQRMVTTVTGQVAWNCEYNYGGQTFWRVFQGSCPYTINVQ